MKRILCIVLILFFTFTSLGSAHTGLTNSVPGEGEEVKGEINEIVLEFNTTIETASTVKVFDEQEKEVHLGHTQVTENVMKAGFLSPLENGLYTVEWKIIGADGHPIQGTYSFAVSQIEIESPSISDEAQDTAAETKEEKEEETMEQPAVSNQSKIASNDVLVIILVLLFSIAGGFFGWIIGRRQSK